MNGIVNKFFLAGDKYMPEMHLQQPRLIYSAYHPFTKTKERMKWYQHGMPYWAFKYLIWRLFSNKLRNKVFNIAKDPKYDDYHRGLASTVLAFLIKGFP